MQTIWAIIGAVGGLEYSGFLIVENPPFMRLVIEALPEQGPSGHPVVSIAHYSELNGDAMRDPEICAEMVTEGHQRVRWPYYFRNDYAGVECWNHSPDPEGSAVCLLSKTRELEDFMAIRLGGNLRDQGFLEARLDKDREGGTTVMLRIHSLLESSQVNGPGQRAVVWFQGCSLACLACWNPETHGRSGGRDLTTGSLVAWVHTLWSKGAISGLTISGGEPLEQAPGLAEFLEKVHRLLPDLSIGLFSGYTETELNRGRNLCFPSTVVEERQQLWRRIRSCLDFAVLGRYNTTQPASDPLVTSNNQRLRVYSERHGYAAFEAQCIEVTIDHQGLTQMTGFPVRAVAAV